MRVSFCVTALTGLNEAVDGGVKDRSTGVWKQATRHQELDEFVEGVAHRAERAFGQPLHRSYDEFDWPVKDSTFQEIVGDKL
jgi:hypothetical protein